MKLKSDLSVHHFHIDASEYIYGHLCQYVAMLLMGKNNVCRDFCKPHNVIIIKNLSNVKFSTDKKPKQLIMYKHSGYMGGLKKRSFKEMLELNQESKFFIYSLRKMIPKNKIFNKRIHSNIIFK